MHTGWFSMFLLCFSPALVDVDAVYFVGTDGDLGQGLNHMVALQNHVSLWGNNTQGLNSQENTWHLSRFCQSTVRGSFRICPRLHLLFVVVTGHVQNKQAIAERADGDTCRGRTVLMNNPKKSYTLSKWFICPLTSDLSELRSRCAAWVWPPLQ